MQEDDRVARFGGFGLGSARLDSGLPTTLPGRTPSGGLDCSCHQVCSHVGAVAGRERSHKRSDNPKKLRYPKCMTC